MMSIGVLELTTHVSPLGDMLLLSTLCKRNLNERLLTFQHSNLGQ